MDKIITIPKEFAKNDLVVVWKKNLEKLSKENLELKMALRAILAGEAAIKRGKTRTFRQFLKSKSPKYSKNL